MNTSYEVEETFIVTLSGSAREMRALREMLRNPISPEENGPETDEELQVRMAVYSAVNNALIKVKT